MTSFDYLVLAILLISALLGLLRGLIKEILSLCAYVTAFLAAVWWGPKVSDALTPFIENPLLRAGVSYFLVFLMVLLLVGLLNLLLSALIERTGLTPADHGLGALFGFLRGLVIVLALVTLAGYTELPQETWWSQARLAGASVRAIQELKLWLPPALAAWLPY